ncbi:hypothetical protein [Lunatibacter salilacus]|uniref:hypothetical protein n=1 Tax=Lunatibacter salilacus TaxID=2483804 RepID=UPI00131E8638|nr:hypothetical protein [Lunatibacter salilacus]
MKTKVLIYPLLLLVGLLFAACHNENDLNPTPNLESPSELLALSDSTDTDPNARIGCRLILIPTVYWFNYIRNASGGCTYRYLNVCRRPGRWVSIPCFPKFPKLPPDFCLSCPPDIFKYFPAEIFEDFRRINPEIINLKANGVTFPLSGNVVGIQFYAENEIINRKGFTLKNSLLLSAEEQKVLGVSGKTIPAGQYPVVYNPKNKTLNAIVAVK